jgi:hypothetical protein
VLPCPLRSVLDAFNSASVGGALSSMEESSRGNCESIRIRKALGGNQCRRYPLRRHLKCAVIENYSTSMEVQGSFYENIAVSENSQAKTSNRKGNNHSGE